MLARAAIETCILGLWCLHDESAVASLQGANVRAMKNMVAWLTDEGLVPAEVMDRMVASLGQPGPVPKVWDMAEKVDSALGGNGAASLYRRLYTPTSNLFIHANAGSLLRHVTDNDQLSRRPSRAWTRRAPARCADATVGILAFQIANRMGTPAQRFASYAGAHMRRIPPPITVIAGINYRRSLSIKQAMATLKSMRSVGRYTWSEQASSDSPGVRKARIREGLETMLNLPQLGIPQDAADAFIDFLASAVAEGDWPGTSARDA
jgi:hypothetical protein